jgi:hypothetical protein
LHDVLLAQRIGVPIVAEADNVAPLNHFSSPFVLGHLLSRHP